MPDKKYKLIIFDLDGTLLDTTEGVIRSVKETVDYYGLEQLTEEQYMAFNGPPMKKSLMRWFGLDEKKADEATEFYRSRYKNGNYVYAEEYEGIQNVLSQLKKFGYLLGVATYKRTDYAVNILKHFGYAKYFDVIVGDTPGSKRTKTDIIQAVCSELSVNPNDVLMIGDTEGDMNGAIEANVNFLGVTYGYGFRNGDLSDGIDFISRPVDLISILIGEQ